MGLVLESRNLSVMDTNESHVLENVCIQLHEGEVHAIVGDSASGKSAFFNVLKGLSHMASGEIFFKGELVRHDRTQMHDVGGIGFVHEEVLLFPAMSVSSNICLQYLARSPRLSLVHPQVIEDMATKILQDLEINIDPRAKVGTLSREQQKLVALAAVFSTKPATIVLDEPGTGLSEDGRKLLNAVISKYSCRGGSVLYLTRHWEHVLPVADQISVLRRGKIVGSMPTKTVRQEPGRLVALMVRGCPSEYPHQELHGEGETIKLAQVILRASELLTSEYELKDVLEFLAERAVSIMGADSCIIELIDEETEAIVDRVQIPHSSSLSNLRIRRAAIKGLMKDTVLQIAADNPQDKSAIEGNHEFRGSIIAVPINIRTKIAGTIQIIYERPFNKENVEVLVAFARQAAIAIENTRLMGRSTLLQESHHRIKNNLQSIVSLLSLQLAFTDSDTNARALIKDCISRIKTIAAVHDILSCDATGRGVINARNILDRIIAAAKNATGKNIIFRLENSNIFLSYKKATSLALVVNELIANCTKHAFVGGAMGEISVKVSTGSDAITIEIRDNGVGLCPEFDLDSSSKLGLSIVEALVTKDLGGVFQLKTDGGTVASIIIPKVEQGWEMKI